MAKKRVSKNVARRSPRPNTAPGQALGYGLQYTRLTSLLLTAPAGSSCSLEVLDDVAATDAEGHEILVQSKSALRANPVADRSEALWKTLANWATAISSGLINPSTTKFEIYVSRKVTGTIISAFDNASSISTAEQAIQMAKEIMWGAPPAYLERQQLPTTIFRHTQTVFDLTRAKLAQLVMNLRLRCGSGSPQADLEAAIAGHPISPSKVKDITDYVCGLVKRQVDQMLEQGRPAVINRDEFHAAYAAHCRRIDRETILKSSARRPTVDERRARLPDVFVRQLDLIDLDYEQKLAAVSDFLMASADRTDWARSGDVDRESFNELDEALRRYWANRLIATQASHKDKPELDQGRILYSDCMSYQISLQAMETPPHFVPGCYHQLADIPELGWHPSYKALLKSAA